MGGTGTDYGSGTDFGIGGVINFGPNGVTGAVTGAAGTPVPAGTVIPGTAAAGYAPAVGLFQGPGLIILIVAVVILAVR